MYQGPLGKRGKVESRREKIQIKVITLHFLRLDKPNHSIKMGNAIRTLARRCSCMVDITGSHQNQCVFAVCVGTDPFHSPNASNHMMIFHLFVSLFLVNSSFVPSLHRSLCCRLLFTFTVSSGSCCKF